MCALRRSLAAEAGSSPSVLVFDAAEDSELEMLMMEKLPTLTAFRLGFSVEWRKLCIYKQSVLRDCLDSRLPGTVALALLYLPVRGWRDLSKQA